MAVLDKEGLEIKLELSYRFKPNEMKIGHLHDTVGSEYSKSIILPAVRSVTREVIGEFEATELYSTERKTIEEEITRLTKDNIELYHIELDAILIKDITLPLTLQQAIEKKLKQEQEAEEYDFRIEKRRKKKLKEKKLKQKVLLRFRKS